MSHELRTPLNGILGYAQHLSLEESLNENQIKSVDFILQSGRHLLTLIEDLLDLSKIEAGKIEINPTEVHFPTFLEGIIGLFEMTVRDKIHIDFIYEEITPLPGVIEIDEKRVRQIIINLLSNAFKFTLKGQVIFKVGVKQNENHPQNNGAKRPLTGQLLFEVEDTGIGMTAAQMEKIFNPFEQVGESIKNADGAGLGLTISKNLVEEMGGTITVKSEPGVMSCFRVEIETKIVSTEPAYIPSYTISSPLGSAELTLLPPSQKTIDFLYDLAMKGELPRLKKEAKMIAAVDQAFEPFAARLVDLVEQFDEDGILNLILSHHQSGT